MSGAEKGSKRRKKEVKNKRVKRPEWRSVCTQGKKKHPISFADFSKIHVRLAKHLDGNLTRLHIQTDSHIKRQMDEVSGKDNLGPDKMAALAVDEQCVKFATIYESKILFEGYESDSFLNSKKCHTRVIQNKDGKFLVVDAESLKFENRNKEQSRKEDCLFNICLYHNSVQSCGLPVILMVSDSGEDRVICCCDHGNGKDVYAKLWELPGYIEESCHEAVFFLEDVKERRNCYRIKSSLWPDRFLSFETMGDGVVKLVLREAEGDVVEGLQLLQP